SQMSAAPMGGADTCNRRMMMATGMTRRRMIFYIGGPKTGASALQLCLIANTAALACRGVDYIKAMVPSVPSGRHSGNGPFLHTFLTLGDYSDAASLDLAVGSY